MQLSNPAPSKSAFDCFYVYPTVSREHAINANLQIQRSEVATAFSQAAPFSQVCRVWAPMYPQLTLEGLALGLSGKVKPKTFLRALDTAYQGVLAAWKDYLRKHNHGRPVILIGHSQGATMLIRLIQSQIDPSPVLRGRTLLAILAGGNLVVPEGKTVGGSFQHLPLCTAAERTGCVIAYSTFPSRPPPDALFGIPGQGVSLMAGQDTRRGLQVACVNPAAVGGGRGFLLPEFPTMEIPRAERPKVQTAWVSFPEFYTARCRQAGDATWLQVTHAAAAGRPVVHETQGPTWGYHPFDINLALGNLVRDVAAAERAYLRQN
jgi:pimeloyl-ACP methyl ester carboxylesterase